MINKKYIVKYEFRSIYIRNIKYIAKSSESIIIKDSDIQSKSRLNLVPVVSYFDTNKDKSKIYEENKNKCGIYRWKNIITGKSYIGSSINLSRRFSSYYSLIYLKRRVKIGTSVIYSSILKNGYSSFSLDILEYCESNVVILREQYYIDLLKPEYNILKIAGSRLGSTQSENTKELISNALNNRVFSDESKEKMRLAIKDRVGIKTSFFGKRHTIETKNKIALKKTFVCKSYEYTYKWI